MKTIICDNSEILCNIKKFLEEKGSIADIFVVEEQENNTVFLVSEKTKISPEVAEIWWDGYKAGMGAI